MRNIALYSVSDLSNRILIFSSNSSTTTAAVKRVVGKGEAILAVAAIWAGAARRTVPPPPLHSIVRGIDGTASAPAQRSSGLPWILFALSLICRKKHR